MPHWQAPEKKTTRHRSLSRGGSYRSEIWFIAKKSGDIKLCRSALDMFPMIRVVLGCERLKACSVAVSVVTVAVTFKYSSRDAVRSERRAIYCVRFGIKSETLLWWTQKNRNYKTKFSVRLMMHVAFQTFIKNSLNVTF